MSIASTEESVSGLQQAVSSCADKKCPGECTELLPRSPRYASLDVWRGAACLAVVLYHSALFYVCQRGPETQPDVADAVLRLFSHLWIGVPVFFVISGYCIAATADKSRRGTSGMWTYFTRRFKRIFPPYWCVLAGSILVVALVDVVLLPSGLSTPPWPQLRPWWFSFSQWIGNVTLTESWRHHVFGSQRGHFVGQSWTLCYEEQFYFVIGVILAVWSRRLFLATGLVTLACIVLTHVAAANGVDISGFFFDGSWLMFAAGILVYYCVNYAGPLGVAWTCLLLALATGATIPGWLLMPRGAVVAFIFAMGLTLLHPWDAAAGKARVLRPVAICGEMCYSLYLVHELVVRIVQRSFDAWGVTSSWAVLTVTVPVCVFLSLVVGWAFHVLIERRFINAPQSLPARTNVLEVQAA